MKAPTPYARTIALWGATGSTKSSQILHLARMVWEQFGLTTRYVMIDDNAKSMFQSSGLVDKGIIDILDLSGGHKSAFGKIPSVMDGYWYREIGGKILIRKEPEFMTTPKEWAKIGLGVCEGGTALAELYRRSITKSDDKKAFNKAWTYEEGGYSYSEISMYHVGLIQQAVLDNIAAMKAAWKCPFKLWTFHEGSGEQGGRKNNGRVMLGPKIAGQAVTTEIGKYFNDLFHLVQEDTVIEGEEKTQKRAWCYYKEHNDDQSSLPCMAAVRILPEYYELLLNKYPEGGVMMSYKRGLRELYEVLFKVQDYEANRIGSQETTPEPKTETKPTPQEEGLAELKFD